MVALALQNTILPPTNNLNDTIQQTIDNIQVNEALMAEDLQGQSAFENTVEALFNPIIESEQKITRYVNKLNDDETQGNNIVETKMLLKLQQSTTELNTAVAVASKSLNLVVKGINQLTQLQ